MLQDLRLAVSLRSVPRWWGPAVAAGQVGSVMPAVARLLPRVPEEPWRRAARDEKAGHPALSGGRIPLLRLEFGA